MTNRGGHHVSSRLIIGVKKAINRVHNGRLKTDPCERPLVPMESSCTPAGRQYANCYEMLSVLCRGNPGCCHQVPLLRRVSGWFQAPATRAAKGSPALVLPDDQHRTRALLCRPAGLAVDLVASEDVAHLEDRAHHHHRHSQCLPDLEQYRGYSALEGTVQRTPPADVVVACRTHNSNATLFISLMPAPHLTRAFFSLGTHEGLFRFLIS